MSWDVPFKDRDGENAAEHFDDRKARRADRAANGTEGTSLRTPSIGEHHQRQYMHGVREPSLQRRYQYQMMCGAGDETLGASAILLLRAASQSRSVPE